MRIPGVENTIFVSQVVRVTVTGTPEGEAEWEVFDVDGTNITEKVRSLTLHRYMGARLDHATLELDLPGFDGPFSTPGVDLL